MPNPQHDPDDTQPFMGDPNRQHRVYVPAVWKPAGTGGGAPKISGGYEIDPRTGNPAPRGWNNINQRYSQPLSTLLANRSARANAEASSTVVCEGALGLYEVRGTNGNNYDIGNSLLTCDCPDWWRIDASGYGIIRCKHIYIVMLALSNPSNVLAYGLAVSLVAASIGCTERTVEEQCQLGNFTAIKVNEVWVIDPVSSPAEVATYKGRLVTFPNAVGGEIVT